MTYAPQGIWVPPRVATLVVAASDSSPKSKAQADYVCDGTDDHVEIQAALDALPADGGEVRLSEGTYYIEVSLALDSNQTLRGCGKNTILTTTTANLDIITATGSVGSEKTGILIADLCIDGDAGGVANEDGILWTYVDYSKIHNVWSQDNGDDGMDFSYCDFNEIIGNTCQGNGDNGINLYRSNYNNTIVGNACQGNGSDGIHTFTTNHNNTISGNTCQGNGGAGICISHSNNNTIVGNTVQGNGYNGIYLEDANNNTIVGNTVQGNGYDGINLSAANNNTISGNTFQGNDRAGIYVETSDNNNIVGNVCLENSQDTDNTSDNIFLMDSDYNLINGNICRRGTQANKPRYGINISNDACDRNCLIGNDLYDSGSTGDLNDVPTTNPTLKHDNRDLAGTGWLAEV